MLVESCDSSDLVRFSELEESFIFVGLSRCEACASMKAALALVFKDREGPDLLMFEFDRPDGRAAAFLRQHLTGRFPELLYFTGGERKRRWVGFFKDEDFDIKVARLAEVIDGCHS